MENGTGGTCSTHGDEKCTHDLSKKTWKEDTTRKTAQMGQ
jgi:hypothetical protein